MAGPRSSALAVDEVGGNLIENLEFNEDNLRRDPSVSLKMLADRTGGFLINNTNNLARGFQLIDADRRFHYLLTYSPKNADFKGEWRRIAVNVSRRDVQVRSRAGYLAVRSPGALPLLAHEGPALADLERTPVPTEVPVRAGVFSLPDAKKPGRLALLVATDAASVTFQPDAAAGTCAPMELSKPDATGRIAHAGQLPLASFPPGQYVLRVTVSQGAQKEARDAAFTVVEE